MKIKSKASNPYSALNIVYERLGVTRAEEIFLAEHLGAIIGCATYIARSQVMSAYVDRALAIRLRISGATWCGEIARDPCATA